MKENKKMVPEVPTQEPIKITWDYGILETSRFYITTDKSFYENMIKNPNVVPMFNPELLSNSNTKEIHQHVPDLQFYAFRIPESRKEVKL